MSTLVVDVEDILQDTLTIFDDTRVNPNEAGRIRYGPLVLTVAPKEGKANTLLADHVFSPSLIIAERIERKLIDVADRTVIELGSGAALPSLLASTLSADSAPTLVVATDYPDPLIMGNVHANLARNAHLNQSKCVTKAYAHEWGEAVSELCKIDDRVTMGYDVVFLSDLLHFHTSHSALLRSLVALLARTPHARTYVGAGKYTPTHVCEDWLRLSEEAGVEWEEIGEEDSEWYGVMEVIWEGVVLDKEALATRKTNCRLWVGKWSRAALIS